MSHPIFARLAVSVVFVLAFSLQAAGQSQTPQPESQPAPLPPPVDPAEGGPVDDPVRVGPVTFSGATWVEYLAVLGDDPNRPIDTFRIRRARLVLAGNAAPKIGWSIGGEFTGTPALRVAFVLFRVSPLFNVRVGQATPPGGLERNNNPLMAEFIERSSLTLQLTNGLEMGMTIMNEAPIGRWVGYAVSVVNGTGFNRTDDNRAKDVIARFRVTPPRIPGLILNVSGAAGEQPIGTRKRSTIGAQYDGRRVRAVVEGIRQRIDADPSSHGVVVYGAWRYRPAAPTPHFRMLEVGARFYYMTDPSTAPPPADEDGGPPPAAGALPETIREFAVAMNYDVTRNVRLMSNVTTTMDDRPTTVTSLTRLQLVF